MEASRGRLASSKCTRHLDLPPSCIAIAPLDHSLVVIGTYHLELPKSSQEEPSRNGSLVLCSQSDSRLSCLQTVPQQSAVLDLRFHPSQRHIIAACSSTATISTLALSSSPTPRLQELAVLAVPGIDSSVLVLQIAWHPTQPHLLSLTTSSGQVFIVALNSAFTAITHHVELDTLRNGLEAWSVSLVPVDDHDNDKTLVLCGGDDSVLRYGTFQLGPQPGLLLPGENGGTISKSHDAGVTAILPLSPTLVLTGSYDDRARLFSIPPCGPASLLADINLGGGVWRLQRMDRRQREDRAVVLASCMHAGVRVVQVSRETREQPWRMVVLARFEEHQSMNYASDFVTPGHGSDVLQCVSTSFYDRLVCLWDMRI